jgi:HSP20 family protein
MSLIPWRPFGDDVEKWFKEEWPAWPEFKFPKIPMIRTPRMDVYETDSSVVAEIELPGVDPKNIEIEVKDNILRIEARAEEKKEVKEKGYYRKETGSRYFKRQVSLPAQVTEQKTEAEYSDGVLKVTMPKVKPKKVAKKKIKIKTKKNNLKNLKLKPQV